MNETGNVIYEEKIIYTDRPSWLYYYHLYIIGIIIFAIQAESGNYEGSMTFILLILSIVAILRYRYYFTVSNERIISRVGLIARNTNEMRVRHIRSIGVRQNPIERILGIGTVIFISAAEGEVSVIFRGIRDPHGVKERVRVLSNVRY